MSKGRVRAHYRQSVVALDPTMELKRLFTADDENRAVSPVIGVILMVAITVILAAVIGTFVLGLGDQVQQTSPNAQWNWDVVDSGDDLNLVHEGGDSIAPARLTVSGNTVDQDCSQVSHWGLASGETVSAGDTCNVDNDGSSNTPSGTYRLTWTAEGGGQSSTLSTYEVQ